MRKGNNGQEGGQEVEKMWKKEKRQEVNRYRGYKEKTGGVKTKDWMTQSDRFDPFPFGSE